MLITVNNQLQMSFEHFQKTFRDVFGRDMTLLERKWLEPLFLKAGTDRESIDEAA